MKARMAGRCGRCGFSFPEGTEIAKLPKPHWGWGHVTCPATKDAAQAQADALTAAVAAEKAATLSTPSVVRDGKFSVPHPYDAAFVQLVRDIPGRSFDGDTKTWFVPVEMFDRAVKDLAGFSKDYAKSMLEGEQFAAARAAAKGVEETVEASRAASVDSADVPAPEGLSYRPFQLAGIAFIAALRASMIGDEMGCLSGSTKVRVNRAGASRMYTLKDVYEKFHGLSRRKNWTPAIPTQMTSMCDGQLRLNDVVDVLDKGVREVVRLTLSSGKELVLTPDHEVAMADGSWIPAGELVVGAEVFTNGTQVCKDCGGTDGVITYKYSKFLGSCKKCTYRGLRKNGNFKSGKYVDTDGYVRVSGQQDHPRANNTGWVYEHILVVEADLGRRLTDREYVHHVDGNKSNNSLENLEVVSWSDHWRRHQAHLRLDGSINGRGGVSKFIPKVDTVASVTPAGTEHVYDVVMADPHRNFVANGVVVHNCGKTIQALGRINVDPTIKAVLVVCPASLRLNWRNEARHWLTREFRTHVCKPVTRKSDVLWNPDANFVIVGYDLLTKLHDEIFDRVWDLVVVDEAHYLKNGKAQRTQEIVGYWDKENERWVDGIPHRNIVMLTGTPLPNRPIELFPLLKLLDPQGLGRSKARFAERYCNRTHNGWGYDDKGAANMDELQRLLRSRCMVRRLKADVLSELPPKVRQIIELPANGAAKSIKAEQKAAEKAAAEELKLLVALALAKASKHDATYEAAVEALKASYRAAFDEMARLRHETAMAKVPYVVEHVQRVVESAGKVVVFCWHRDVVEAIQTALEAGSKDQDPIKCVRLIGGMSADAAQASVQAFQTDPSVKVFIGNIKAAGVGHTLTASSHVVFAELDWVPGNVSQAEDRCVIQGSMITTQAGPKKAEDVVRGDYVWTHLGRWREVLATFRRNYTGAMVSLTAKRSKTPLKTTYGHPIYVIKQGETAPSWQPAESVQIGDYLVVSRPTQERSLPNPLDLSEYLDESISQNGPNGCRQISGRLQMKEFVVGDKVVNIADPRFLMLLGWYLAEGYVRKASTNEKNPGTWKAVGFSLCSSKEKKVGESIALYIKDLFGVTTKFYESKREDSLDCRVNSTVLAQLFGKMAGTNSYTKKLPSWVLDLPLDLIKIVFDAYIAGDGHKVGNQVSCISVSHQLIYQMREVALSLGQNPAIRYYPDSSPNKRAATLSFTDVRSGAKLETHPDYLLRRVTRVEHYPVSREKVVNYKVREDESYTCEDAAVHNCHRIGQTESVTVQHLVLEGSIDAQIARTIVEKQEVLDAVLDNRVEQEELDIDLTGDDEADEAARFMVTFSDGVARSAREREERAEKSAKQSAARAARRQQLLKAAADLTDEQVEAIHECLRDLAGVCDGAREKDGVGFNAVDTGVGRALAAKASLSREEAALGREIVRHYPRQVGGSEAYTKALGASTKVEK